MTYLQHTGFLIAAASISLTFLPVAVNEQARGQEVVKPDGAGIIWCIGAVQYRSDGQPTVDMGDAHALGEGSEVSVFRAQDGHFRPLGVMRIAESFATWSIPAKSSSIELLNGDRIVYVRTLSGLGTGDDFREGFLRQQLIKKGVSNGYSTAMQQEEAETLHGYITRQPRWTKQQKHIAGTIRSASISRKDLQEMQPLLKQVMKLQDYEKLGVPIQKAIGVEWHLVLQNLQVIDPSAKLENTGSVMNAATSPAVADTPEVPEDLSDSLAASEQRLETIQRVTDKLLFIRTPEERKLVTVLCAALEKAQARNERQWFALQIASSQFEQLSDDAQFLDDIETVMRQVRQFEQQ